MQLGATIIRKKNINSYTEATATRLSRLNTLFELKMAKLMKMTICIGKNQQNSCGFFFLHLSNSFINCRFIGFESQNS